MVRKLSLEAGADAAVPSNHWAEGGAGAIELARAVVEACRAGSSFKLLYEDQLSIKDKILTIGKEMYGAAEVTYSDEAEARIKAYTEQGYSHLPICMAKTQYSFSSDPNLKGAPSGKWPSDGQDTKM